LRRGLGGDFFSFRSAAILPVRADACRCLFSPRRTQAQPGSAPCDWQIVDPPPFCHTSPFPKDQGDRQLFAVRQSWLSKAPRLIPAGLFVSPRLEVSCLCAGTHAASFSFTETLPSMDTCDRLRLFLRAHAFSPSPVFPSSRILCILLFRIIFSDTRLLFSS